MCTRCYQDVEDEDNNRPSKGIAFACGVTLGVVIICMMIADGLNLWS